MAFLGVTQHWGVYVDVSKAGLPKPLAQLYSYWQEKRGDRLMPSRADINPVEMQAFLPHTMLIDVLTDAQGELRFKTRLIGTHIVAGFGGDLTGKYIDEIEVIDQRDVLIGACLYSVINKKPAYLCGKLRLVASDEFVAFERLGVPLSSDDENVNMLLVAASVQRSSKRV